MEIPVTPAEALKAINQQLNRAGVEPISRATFYRLQPLFVQTFPRTKLVTSGRLLYVGRVIRFLYLCARLQVVLRNYRLTRLMLQAVMDSLQGAGFDQRFPTMSAIDSFFATEFQRFQTAA